MANVEQDFRKFVRDTFKAKSARDENGEFVTKVRGRSARTMIQNFATVYESLSEFKAAMRMHFKPLVEDLANKDFQEVMRVATELSSPIKQSRKMSK